VAPPTVDHVLASPGKVLDPALRQDMEQRFGYDFSGVRVHSGPAAEQSARDVSARAYTSGRHIVFARGRDAPGTREGRRLLAHELAHIVQQRGHGARGRIARDPDDEEEGRKRRAAEGEQVGEEEPVKPSEGSGEAAKTQVPSTVSTGGHRAAPTGVAPCPDAPGKNLVVLACTAAPAAAPPPKEKAELPTPSVARFGGDADRAKFAKELAQCHAERIVNDEIAKRFSADVEASKKKAAVEAKTESEEAVKAATAGLTERREIAKATSKAQTDAKKATAKKMADAAAAVKKQDVATVTAELATKFEDALATDFDNTIKGAFARFGKSWLNTMQARLDSKRKQITAQKSAKPKVPKGETPAPAKSPDDIVKEIEADMADVRCEQKQWALQQIEDIARAWAVGRREQVDFETIKQTASYLSKFGPTYTPTTTVDIPADIQSDKGMPGVAPEMADFLTALKADPSTVAFKAGNYRGHGGGSWAGKGFSVDLTLSGPLDQRGFWQHSSAVDFLMQIDKTARAMGARWRVLYNDFRVAEEVNAATGMRNVEFIGSSSATDLNWHGPAPLILHFHLDLEIPQKPVAPQGTMP
jgi:hypothetical protein